MSRARNLADLLDANGDVASGALDNVPPSNDASALTTGTLPVERLPDAIDVNASAPADSLSINSSGHTVFNKRIFCNNGSGGDGIFFSSDGSSEDLWHVSPDASGNLDFVESGVATGRLFLEKGGNVGIRSTNPYFMLDMPSANGRSSDGWLALANGVMAFGAFSGGYALEVEFTDTGPSSYTIEILLYGYSNNYCNYVAGEYLNHGGFNVIRSTGTNSVTRNQDGSAVTFTTGAFTHGSYFVRITYGGAGGDIRGAAPLISLV